MEDARFRTCYHPDQKGHDTDADHNRHEDGGDVIGKLLDRSLASLGLSHEAYDLGKGGARSRSRDADHKAARGVHGARRNGRPRGLLYRQRLSGQHRLVDGAFSLNNHPVGGDLTPRENPEPIPGLNFRNGNLAVGLPVLAHKQGGRRGEVEQLAKRRAGLCTSSGLEPLSHEHKSHDDRCGFKIIITGGSVRNEHPPEHQHRDAVKEGDTRPKGDERKHVQVSRCKRPKAF